MSRGASESVKYLEAANPRKEVAIRYGINNNTMYSPFPILGILKKWGSKPNRKKAKIA